jgi:hypothetical protein
MKRILSAAVLGVAAATTTAQAGEYDLDALSTLAQPLYGSLINDLGAAFSYKAITPAEPLGIIGFDVGIELSATSLNSTEAFKQASGGSSLSTLPVPRLHIHKGLPFSFDVGLSLVQVPKSEISLVGAELRYAILDGGITLPAVAVRATYAKLSGVKELDFSTMGYELTVSKGFLMLTPYAGVGQVLVKDAPKVAGLKAAEPTLNKSFIGANLNLGLINLAAEIDQTGDARTTSIKFGLRF